MGAVVFHVGIDISYERRVPWDGVGPLPEAVLAYVREHGTLPRYATTEVFAGGPQTEPSDIDNP